MSSRRSRSRAAAAASPGGVSDEQIGDLVAKLQALLPEAGRRRGNDGGGWVLQETCSYIRSLHREVDDLSDRLAQLLDAADVTTAQAALIRSLLLM